MTKKTKIKPAKYGFVYIWRDRKHKRYYIGSHWGYEDDGYICSSPWMKNAYTRRPKDFKRRILFNNCADRIALYDEELRWIKMIKRSEIKPANEYPRYYNLNIGVTTPWFADPTKVLSIGQKISAAKKGKKLGPPEADRGAKIAAAKALKNPGPGKKAVLAALAINPNVGVLTLAKQFNTNHKTMTRWLAEYNIPAPTYIKASKPKVKGSTTADRWADPEWAAMMKAKLAEGAQRRLNSSTTNRKTWLITDPSGTTHTVTDLKSFCDERDMKPSSFSLVASGKQKHYRNYTASLLA